LTKIHKIIDNIQKFSLTEINYAMESLRKDEIVGKGVVVME
jgi:D-arabinose 1-dehydrogenase-like Zn-dependent alcohol dehydrogenase